MRMRISLGVALLLGLGATAASAQSMIEIAAGVKFCRTLKDDAQRLKCFDQLFVEKPSQPDRGEIGDGWNVVEKKSPVDDSPQVTAIAETMDGRGLLVMRCREKVTDVYFGAGSRGSVFFGSGSARVIVRIDDGKPIETRWTMSTDGQAVFAPSAVQFIRALPNDGKLFIRGHGYRGELFDGEFKLGRVSEIRDKIAQACKWPGEPRR